MQIMSEVKANLIGAVTVMDEDGARRLWEIVKQMYSANSWDAIEASNQMRSTYK